MEGEKNGGECKGMGSRRGLMNLECQARALDDKRRLQCRMHKLLNGIKSLEIPIKILRAFGKTFNPSNKTLRLLNRPSKS